MGFKLIPLTTQNATRAYTASTVCYILVVICSLFCLCIDCDAKKWMSLNVLIVTLAITPLIVFRFAVEGTYKEQIRVLQQGHTDQINNLEETYNNRIQTLEKVHETELQKHTKHIEQLQESLNIEKEKVEDLRKAFDKTTDEKVQVLNEEIRSLNVMLNIRNEEIRQLHKDIESEKLVIEKYQLAEKEASNKLQEYEHDASNYKKVVDENRRLRSELNKAVHEVEVLKSNLNSKDSVIQLYTQRVECLEAARGRPDGQREHMIFDDETY